MKLQPSANSCRRASVILATICVSVVVGIVLVCCINLVNSQNRSVVRSQSWNICIPLLEAGIEEAMAHLNNKNETSYSANGWKKVGDDYYRSRPIGEGFYDVKISITNPLQPTIVCTGYVRAPLVLSDSGHSLLASAVDVGGVRYIYRAVRAVARRSARFPAPMLAKNKINMNGNNIQTDSFDSTDLAYSTPTGLYDPSKPKDNGDVVTLARGTNIINVGNANIKGHLRTGPGGTAGFNANATVGSLGWHAAGNKGIESGWATDDMNMEFDEVIRPNTAGALPPISGVVTGRVYKYLLTGGLNILPSLTVGSKEKIGVTNRTILVVDGNVDIRGAIEIHPGGALELYVGGADAYIGGQGVNNTGRATNFVYYGLPTNKKLNLPSNGDFTGVICAPNADLQLNGGGSTDLHFTGSCVMNNITVNGHYKFHYDESLANLGPKRDFVIVSWLEL